MEANALALSARGLLAAPLGQLENWRMFWVNLIKTQAIRLLHRSCQGELLLLRMYYLAESATVLGISRDVRPLPMPDWLLAINARHLEEEGVHIKLFAEAIKARGGSLPSARKLDWLSRFKLGQWVAIAQRYRSRFSWDGLVPAYAIGLCAEQMALRVLERHGRAISGAHAFRPLLDRVLADEAQHVETCADVLLKLVEPGEMADLHALLAELRRVDYSWGLVTAIGMFCVACWCAARGLLASSR